MPLKFKAYKQPNIMDCGPTCLKMILRHFGKNISLDRLRKLSETNRAGSSLHHIARAAEKLGLRTLGVKIGYEKLEKEVVLPCIIHWKQTHFVVVYKISKSKVWVADPAHGKITYSKKEFLKHWLGPNANAESKTGICLLLEATPNLSKENDDPDDSNLGFGFIFPYLAKFKGFIVQLVFGLLAGSLLQLIFPFLTQSIVDVGIQNQDIGFVYIILLGQLFLFLGRTAIELIRGWLLLHLSTRINISLLSDFFIKLMRLPISYFDIKMTGDIMQRIGDHKRIERLLTTQSLDLVFSLFNLVVFGAILAWYNNIIFGVFMAGSLLYFLWIAIFLKKRRALDFKRFAEMSEEQSTVIELINGMQEIKLHNAEQQKRWSWEHIQARLFKVSIKSFKLEQAQTLGSGFINEIKNIFITVLSAQLVITGEITLGMMLSISYIIGQLNGPIQRLIGFTYSLQDAKIALERLSEIHNRADEEEGLDSKIHQLPEQSGIVLNDVNFRYDGAKNDVLKSISLDIKHGKTTALVGASGSGKTTLIKMLLQFYSPVTGNIKLGSSSLNHISQSAWRNRCGIVMQEGHIFNDTIANNIALGQENIELDRLEQAARIAHIKPFIESLPLGYNTKVGLEGVGMSTGQKQRILIARAVYKNPEYIFFDEATSALDAESERIIMKNLVEFFKDKTSVVIAHRLSTVRNADLIVVLENGKIVEKGKHNELVQKQGRYYSLVKNQLQLEKIHA